MKRVFIAIDLSNINGAVRALSNGIKLQLDWNKLIDRVSIGLDVIEKKIYFGVNGSEGEQGFMRFLEANGFTVQTKPFKVICADNGGTITKANSDVEIATDISRVYWRRECDEVILFSGDSDFEYMIQQIKSPDITITIVSSRKTISRELHTIADRIIFLDDIIKDVKREN